MNTEISKTSNATANQTLLHILLIACGIAFMLAIMISQPAHADRNTPPDVPSIIQVPEGNSLFRVAHAVGTQDYVCLSTGWGSPAYGPLATLFNDNNEQILTHFLSPYPVGANSFWPTWQDSHDTSTVWANPVQDAKYTPDPTAIPWLLLQVIETAEGPTGGDKMVGTTYIQRVNTTGGLKPTGPCSPEGARALVPYTADDYFYKEDNK